MKVVGALWVRNIIAFWRNKPALIANLVIPFFFVYVFSSIFQGAEVLMIAGIIIATVFDSSLRISSKTIDDMTSGFMKEVLVSPIPRITIAVGQFLSSATVGTLQGLLIYIVGMIIFPEVRPDSALTAILAIAAMIFVGLIFAGFGLLIASKAKDMQTFQAVSMAITMPMTFISGAYIPLSQLPEPLHWVGRFNPMSYAVHFFRDIAIANPDTSTIWVLTTEQETIFTFWGMTITPLISIFILVAFGVIFLILSTITFTRVDFSKMARNKEDAVDMWS
ncbi:MAG: ABC transporter permease [Defluviitaleaceae bacterium]|nr:ABC transporter permease [Defluviitaleaceae bacterium]